MRLPVIVYDLILYALFVWLHEIFYHITLHHFPKIFRYNSSLKYSDKTVVHEVSKLNVITSITYMYM